VLPVVAVSVFALVSAGVYLLLQRSLIRVAIGLGLLSHGVHLILLSAGRWGVRAPLIMDEVSLDQMTDPLPQAFVLTAIVISMATTLYLLAGIAAVARRGRCHDVEPAPCSDGEHSPDEILAELEGKGGRP
jgi:multicomponent Na+:H+ antiporter subunit C